jgi:hypothetical protein
MSATVHDVAAHRQLTIGRQSASVLTAISLFDGVLAEAGNGRFGIGLFSGVQPEPVGMGFSSDILQHGAFVQWHQTPLAARRWNVTTGGVTSTQGGQPNRDFLFAQGSYGDGRTWLWLSQEMDVNRGWKRALGEPALSATNTFFNGRTQLARALSVSGGYDNRRSVRLYRDRLTPETEFDDRYRQGGWLGLSVTPGRLRFDGDARATGGAPGSRSTTWTMSAEASRLSRLNASLKARISRYGSDAVISHLLSLGLGLQPSAHVRVELSGGERLTRNALNDLDESARWEQVDMDVTLARRWYLNGSFDRTHGVYEDTRQEYVGLSWRF